MERGCYRRPVVQAEDVVARTKLVARCAAILWLALTGMYALVFWPFALPAVVPIVALVARPESRRVLQGSAILGLIATALGVIAYQNTTADLRLNLIGVIVLPLAITLFSGAAAWRLQRLRPAS